MKNIGKIFLGTLLASGILLAAVHTGRYFEREDIKNSIRSQQATGESKIIRIHQLRMSLIPLDRGFIAWWPEEKKPR